MAMSPERTDPRVDAYIAAAAPFARPILERLRRDLHGACPDVEEAIKWSHPFFLLDGRLFASMSAFSAHCGFGFWQDAKGAALDLPAPKEKAMGQFGRIATLADLPSSPALRSLIAEAARQAREARVSPAPAGRPARKAPRAPLPLPDDFASALQGSAAARAAFDAFAPGQRREYIEWILEARQASTRERRIAQAVAWIAEGKERNWKYRAC